MFSNPPGFRLTACQPASLTACQPAVRPTSGGSIGPVFSHHEGYRRVITNLLFW